MTRYHYVDQGGERVLTRAEVLAEFFPWWSEQMRKVGRDALISDEACLEDWLTVHWGWTVADLAGEAK